MIVTCAHCATRYVMDDALLGPAGARVRCPRCEEHFIVAPPGPGDAPAPEAAPARPAGAGKGPPPADPSPDPELDALETRLGPGLAAAHTRGRLFADHGPALLDAFDAFRRRSARPDAAAAFRAALERRWAIRLGGRGED